MTRHTATCLAATLSMTVGLSAQVTFRSGIDVVEVDALVMRGNTPVNGLTSSNFVVTDNGVRQEVTSVTQGQVPLRITLVVDTSASVSGRRLTALVNAGNALADALEPADQLALITFSHQATLRVPMGSPVSTFRTALARAAPSGATSVRDAVHLALLAPPEEHTRSLCLVLSDGRDTTSWLPEEHVIETARRSNIVIEAIRFEEGTFLDRLADATGGRAWSGRSERDLIELFTRALKEMRSRYVITYSPAERPAVGWHRIKVSLRNARGNVTARPSYLVP
jgi:VWFA-related protein